MEININQKYFGVVHFRSDQVTALVSFVPGAV